MDKKKKELEKYDRLINESEEIRDWFKVSENRKKIWNIQLWLLEELKKICKKHNIKYYADWGTLLGAVRHNWFIPRDDDLDIWIFSDDFEKFIKFAKNEIPENIKIFDYYWWFIRFVDTNTTALKTNENWQCSDFIGGIWIDIFPIYFASKYYLVNVVRSKILYILRSLLFLQKSWRFIIKREKWKTFIVWLIKFFFKKFNINYQEVFLLHKKINQNVIFKWEKVYTPFITSRFFPFSIFSWSHIVKFEDTTINIPNWYDEWLRIAYWDYMKPVIFSWWHNCWYSIDKSYKDIIKTFDKSKSNEENYKNCKDLFVLD